MFLASYSFTGDIDDLKAGHAKMLETLGTDGIFMHVAVVRDDTLTVLDACPSESVFHEFSEGPFFASLVKASGLPHPTVTPLGEVHRYVFEQPK